MYGKEYYLGLDMGVSSVGWAVTDKNYNLLRVKGKDLWGIREFDEAKTSAERRTHRISRRRRQREVVRIGLLKDYFHDAIHEKDPNFYQRLENSKYYLEDKDKEIQNKNSIFNDPDYQDTDYYHEFPTIFHLRQELIHNPEAHDVRFVYLALLNMFKHRGHFLNAGLSTEGESRKLSDVYTEFCVALQEEAGIVFNENIDKTLFEEIISNKEYSRSKKAEELTKLLKIDKKEKNKIEFLRCICGLKVQAKRLFENLELDNDKKQEICFSDYGYEEKVSEISDALGDKYYPIVELMKEIYDLSILSKIMRGYSYLSDARVAEYNKHANDLKILKSIVKQYCAGIFIQISQQEKVEVYDYLFRSEKPGTYSAYVNSLNSGSKSRRGADSRKAEDLYKTIKPLIKKMPQEDKQVQYVLQEIENENFLPKQLTASNGVIPNQVHARELRKILENAENYLPFLKTKDSSGYTVSERILKLFSFQIPYYIGPTSEDSKTGWIVRKEPGRVLPWNLEEKIDVKETSEQFISRMVRRCSYISGEMVLPKDSLEYESFRVLNEINNLSINGERIPVSLKQDIYNDLFKNGKKVSRKNLVEYLQKRGFLTDEKQLSGIDVTINNSLSTYGKFKAILGNEIDTDAGKRMTENIVFWCTIYNDSKKLLIEKIEEHYGHCLTEQQIKRIVGFKFKDWGRLSKSFLELPGCDKSIGEKVSLIRMMWETNCNLMELVNSPLYTYKEELESRQSNMMKPLTEMQPEDLDEWYFSAPVKRMIWQTLLIIKELEQILGAPPTRLFIEMTRKPDDKKSRTISRKQRFLDLYKNIKTESRDWKTEIEHADANGTLKSKKMYLYLTQMGRCMYTGEDISLDQLFNDNLYDIDHIYPRHFVKDDNIENNLVLVKKDMNAHKSDTYPLEESIFHKQRDYWKSLLDKNLINEEKYKRLTGRRAFTEEQKADFIARQLVETSQGVKGVADILKQLLPNTTLVYSKASNVSAFRQSRDIVKCRSVNDFHHAHDAYLNIVVGNVYYVKFTQNPLNFILKEYSRDANKYHYNLSRMFDWDVSRGDEIAWVAQKKDGAAGTIAAVKKTLAKNTPLMSRRSFEAHGAIANETLYSKKKATQENYIPLKSNDSRLADVCKYGGFTSVSTAYFFLVEHTEKRKRIRTIETVPIYMVDKIKNDPNALTEYCIDTLELQNPVIRLAKIKIQSLIKKDGYFAHISGKTGNRIILRNAVNLCLQSEWIQYIKKIEKSIESGFVDKEVTVEKNNLLYTQLTEKHNQGIFSKRPNPVGEKLTDKQNVFNSLDILEQCKVLAEILKLTAIGPCNGVDLSSIKEGTQCGKTLMPKKINNSKELILIHQSVTGVFEKQIDLLTV